VAQSYGRAFLQAGDEIIVSAMEHHSNIVPWQMLCQQVGAKLRVIPINHDGEIVMDEYQRLLNDRTKFVSVTHVSNALGTVVPVKQIVDLAHGRGVPVLLDGAQAVPHLQIDVQDLLPPRVHLVVAQQDLLLLVAEGQRQDGGMKCLLLELEGEVLVIELRTSPMVSRWVRRWTICARLIGRPWRLMKIACCDMPPRLLSKFPR